jgi:hypothetical protein
MRAMLPQHALIHAVTRKVITMNCYMCDCWDRATEAVAICRHCGIALCREHVDEALLARRPAGLAGPSCIHNPVGTARWREDVRALESLW